jgi:hypothetical protein
LFEIRLIKSACNYNDHDLLFQRSIAERIIATATINPRKARRKGLIFRYNRKSPQYKATDAAIKINTLVKSFIVRYIELKK